MESTDRSVWVVVAVLAAILLLACCCALVVGGAVLAGSGVFSSESGASNGQFSERLEETLSVGEAPSLVINNFAGNVSIRAGESGTIHVIATKRASRSRDLSVIGVGIHETQDGAQIKTGRPLSPSNAAVDLEITAPADSRLDLRLGAGNVDVRGLGGGAKMDVGAGTVGLNGVTGALSVETGAGTVIIGGADGRVQARTGAGTIVYQGSPQGNCRFSTGTGAITLELPAHPNVTVDLRAGAGAVEAGCPVDGQISKRRVQGAIGNGEDAHVEAQAGAGGISLTCK